MVVSTRNNRSPQRVDTGPVPGSSRPEHVLLASHLAAAMGLITEPWWNSILRAAFPGVRRFDAFQHVLRAPRQRLSLRLAYLVDIGLLRRQRLGDNALRQEYRLTAAGVGRLPPAGRGLFPTCWHWRTGVVRRAGGGTVGTV